jgi:hypothetical protein
MMRRAVHLASILCACAVALIVVGVVIGPPKVGFEGAYFDRANGVPAYAGVFSQTAPGLFDPSDGNLWIGAGLVALLLAAALFLSARRHRDRDQDAAP